jgi:SOS-response transcriptional repressor LexA
MIDGGLLINWIVSGALGLIFGIIGGYVTYRFDLKREKLKLDEQWKQKLQELDIQHQQKLQELGIQYEQERQAYVRRELTRGLENLSRALDEAVKADSLRVDSFRFYPVYEKIPAGGFGPVGYEAHPIGRAEIAQILVEGQPHYIIRLPSARSFRGLGEEYVLVRAYGDSMNLVGINDGDYVLVYCPPTGVGFNGDITALAHDGDIVVAQIVTAIESEATIKRFRWKADKVILEPCSNNPIHKPRVFTESSEGFHIRAIALAVLKPIKLSHEA